MYQDQRMELILKYLEENKRIAIDDICELFKVSKDTARRDLVKLEDLNLIIRSRGGAILPSLKENLGNYNERLKFFSNEKSKIGKMAASLIKDNETIIMDSSTTVQACSDFIDNKNITIITNSIHQADILSDKDNITIKLLGGLLDKSNKFLYGSHTIESLSNYNADKLFIGALGISIDGLTLNHEEESYLIRKMIEQSDKVIVLADYSKFEKTGSFILCSLSDIDVIITDKAPSLDFQKVIIEKGIKLLVTSK